MGARVAGPVANRGGGTCGCCPGTDLLLLLLGRRCGWGGCSAGVPGRVTVAWSAAHHLLLPPVASPTGVCRELAYTKPRRAVSDLAVI
jgi:hypothetical protein